jgi:hypothetical protein
MGWYDRRLRRVRDLSCGDTRVYLELEVRRLDCRGCGKVKREQLDFLANNPLFNERFAYYVGRRCRGAPIKEVAAELKLDWHTVKALDQQYMEAQLKRAGTPVQRQSASTQISADVRIARPCIVIGETAMPVEVRSPISRPRSREGLPLSPQRAQQPVSAVIPSQIRRSAEPSCVTGPGGLIQLWEKQKGHSHHRCNLFNNTKLLFD